MELEAVGKIQLALDSGGNREVGIVTCYCLVWGLNRPGILSRWWRGFPLLSRPSLGPAQPPIQWALGLFGGKAIGVSRCPPTLSSAEVKERVGIYIYSPSGP
jgi:hypothetical protein